MPPSTRDLLASVLGELPPSATACAPIPAATPPASRPLPSPYPKAKQPADQAPGPWRVSAKVSSGQVQISNNLESRVVPKEQVEVYLRGHGPAAAPAR